MKHGALFAGINGFGLAASWAGIETTWISEIDPYCLKVNKKNFPNAIQYGDIKELYKPEYVDVISGGFPCQSFSFAGEGAMDLSLWKEMLRIVQYVKPRWVFAENVLGFVARKKGVAIESVCSGLENEGYTVLPPFIIPACGIGALHRRDRAWIIARRNVPNAVSQSREELRENRRMGREQEQIQGNTTRRIEPGPIMGRKVNGIPGIMDRHTSLGNAIDPYIAYEFFNVILEIEKGE